MSSNSRAGNKAPIPPAIRAAGRKLQDARREAGLTQPEAGGKIGVTPETIRNWEAGRFEPNNQFKQQLSEIYNVNVPELFRPDDPDEGLGLTPNSRVHADPKRLKLGRRRKRLTQEEAGERAGIGVSTLSRYENGVATPSRASLERLAALYGRPPIWFVPRERMRKAGKLVGTEDFKQSGPYDDEVTHAYGLAQPDLTTEAIKSIVDFIRFLHDQELSRSG